MRHRACKTSRRKLGTGTVKARPVSCRRRTGIEGHMTVFQPMEMHVDWSLFSGVGPTPTIYDERNNTFSTTENTAPSSFYPLMYSGYGLIDDCHMEVIMDYEGVSNTYETYMMAKGLDNLNFIGATSYNDKVMLYERRAGNWINPGVETPVTGTIGQLVEMDVVGD